MNGVQVISITEGTMKPIIVHLCEHYLESAEANQNPLKHPCLIQLSRPVSQLGFSCWRNIPQHTLASARSKEQGKGLPQKRSWGKGSTWRGFGGIQQLSLKFFLQRNSPQVPNGSLTASMHKSLCDQAEGPHAPLTAIPSKRTGKSLIQITTTLLSPFSHGQQISIPTYPRWDESLHTPFCWRKGMWVTRLACYLLRGYLGFWGDSLPQPGHRSRDGHRHPDPHAVRALPLIHHSDVEWPAESTGGTAGAGLSTSWQHLQQSQPNLGASRQPISYRALPAVQIHLTLEVNSAAARQVRLISKDSFLTTWTGVTCFHKQNIISKKPHKVKKKPLYDNAIIIFQQGSCNAA